MQGGVKTPPYKLQREPDALHQAPVLICRKGPLPCPAAQIQKCEPSPAAAFWSENPATHVVGASIARPCGFPVRFRTTATSRAGHAPPLQMTRKIVIAAMPRPYIALIKTVRARRRYYDTMSYYFCLSKKPSPIGRRWRARAPDEGEVSGICPLISHLR